MMEIRLTGDTAEDPDVIIAEPTLDDMVVALVLDVGGREHGVEFSSREVDDLIEALKMIRTRVNARREREALRDAMKRYTPSPFFRGGAM